MALVRQGGTLPWELLAALNEEAAGQVGGMANVAGALADFGGQVSRKQVWWCAAAAALPTAPLPWFECHSCDLAVPVLPAL